jgi:hypothetical protein
LLDNLHVQGRSEWLIEELDRAHCRVAGVVVADFVEDVQCVLDRVIFAPIYCAEPSRVVETVL